MLLAPRGSPLPPQAYEISNLAKDFGISRGTSPEISGGISGFPGISGRDFWDFRFRARFLGFPVGFQDFNGTQ